MISTNPRYVILDREADRRARWAAVGRWALALIMLVAFFLWSPM